MACLSDDLWAAMLGGALDAERAQAAHDHVDSCRSCGELFAMLGKASAAAAPTGAELESLGETAPHLPWTRAGDDEVTLAPGSEVARFIVEERIGKGGMGVVYRAFDPTLGRRVALKLLRRGGDPELLTREAQALARLAHPNIVVLYDVGQVDGRVFLAMEHIEGLTLSDWLARRPRRWREVLAVHVTAGRGLAAAHAVGLVHRDYKPANVMIGDDGRVRVLDFGLVRPATSGGVTSDGTGAAVARPATELAGTPAYMAPEQRRGTDDARSDQYSFCVTLAEALTGERPTAGDARGVLARLDVVPRRLRRALARGLAPAPAARFATMDALLDELTVERPRRGWVALPAVLAALAVGAAAYVVVRARSGEWRPVVRDLPNLYEEKAVFPAFSPDGTTVAYASDREDRHRTWRLYVEPLAGGRGRTVATVGVMPQSLRWARDGRSLLYVERPSLRAHRAPLTGGPTEPLGDGVRSVDDCGGGRLLLARRGAPDCPACSSLTLRSPDGGEREVWRSRPREYALHARCDPAGAQAQLYLSRPGDQLGELWLVPLAGGTARAVVSRPIHKLGPPASFSADGTSLVYSEHRDGQENLFEVDLGDGHTRQLTAGTLPQGGPEASPDGKHLISVIDMTTYWLSSLHGNGAVSARIASGRSLGRPIATPDGAEVVATRATADDGHLEIVAYTVDGASERVLGTGTLWDLSPDGTEVIATQPVPGAAAHLLVALSRTTAAPRLIAQLDDAPAALLAGADGALHLTLRRDGRVTACAVPLAGGPLREEAPAPWSLVVPVAGGWRLATRTAGAGIGAALHLIPPGAPLDDPSARVLNATAYRLTADQRTLVYAAGTALRRHRLATGEDVLLHDRPSVFGFAPSPDGATLFVTEEVGSSRPQLITNFADRPR